MTADELARLPGLLSHGAEAFGFLGEVWNSKRVAVVIQREFGVSYHPDHVGRLLRAAGWSPQKPMRRATQRDEAAITAWTEERWPALEAKLEASNGPSSGWTNRPSIPCLVWSAPMPLVARRPSYEPH